MEVFLLFFVLLLQSGLTITTLREVLRDCFISNGYKSKIRKIHAQQTCTNKFTYRYAIPYIKKNKKDFLRVFRALQIFLVADVLAYVTALVFVFLASQTVCWIIMCSLIVAKEIFLWVIRLALYPKGISMGSVFRKRDRK